MLKTISHSLFSLVFPAHCPLCGDLLGAQEKDGVCSSCQRNIHFIPSPHCPGCGRQALNDTEHCGYCKSELYYFDRAYACCVYQSGVKELLLSFKFGRSRSLAAFFSKQMTRFVQENIPGAEQCTAVPVPMPLQLRQERGFNQSELLSRRLARSLGMPHAPKALGCRNSGKPQALLGKKERKANAQGLFFVRDKIAVAGKNILLVDDILTTGHTASACARALKEAEANKVTVLTFARGT